MKAAFPTPAISAALAAALLAACATAPLTLDDNMIVPGERIGEVELGMPLSTLMALKGAPLTTTPIKDTKATTYTFEGLTVAADDEVYWIIATQPTFHTSGGVAPGVEQIFARAAFGKPKCVVTRETVTAYDYGNIYFEADNVSGKVTQVGILKSTPTCRG